MKRVGPITHPCLTPVRMVKGSVSVPLSQDGDEVGRAPKHGQCFPKRFTIDGVEGLSQVNECNE